jgi:hypothetical protein
VISDGGPLRCKLSALAGAAEVAWCGLSTVLAERGETGTLEFACGALPPQLSGTEYETANDGAHAGVELCPFG